MKRIAPLAAFLALAMVAAPALAADLDGGMPYLRASASSGDGGAGDAADNAGYLPAAINTGVVARIKDIAKLQSTRDNQLIGYGLVIGLQGTGDSLRNSPFTEQSIRAMLENLGIATEGGQARAKNVAAVIVTANLPPFVQSGARIDVNVSSLGDSTSLNGGTLVMTPLKAADGQIYAVAQGSVSVSGFAAQGQAETLTQGVPTAGRVANGAIVEREVTADFNSTPKLTLQLINPDFSTAVRVADAINAYTKRRFGKRLAHEQDSRTVLIDKPARISTARFYAELENLPVEAESPARVVIDERTGTIVIGQDVKISRVAISHGTMTVRVTEQPRVVQPEPFSKGVTAVEPSTNIEATQPGGRVAVLDGPDLQTLVAGLNRIGAKPTDIIAILQGIKSAGALQAELVVQ
jgi:flagellar P-ring protein precursor FlgI